MAITTAQILALTVPALFLLCSGVFAFTWVQFRSQAYLVVLSLSFFIVAIATVAVVLMGPVDIGWIKMLTGCLYLCGALLLARGVLARINARFDTVVLLGIAMASVVGQAYFYYVGHDYVGRICALNYGVGGILSIAALRMGMLRRGKSIDRIVYWVYVLFALNFFPRTYFAVDPALTNGLLATGPSTLWAIMHLILMLFAMALVLTVLAAVVLDIIEVLKVERNIDGLTQLHNRRGFEELGNHEIANRRNESISLLLCDIDYFKQVNDKYGHAVGDSVLTEFAQILRHCARTVDIVGRFGGEEFIVLLPGTSADRAVHVAQRMRTLLAATRFSALPEEYVLTASFGVAGLRKGETLRDLFARADALLYGAKADGRDRVVLEGYEVGEAITLTPEMA
ncbi:MAG TPA: GGDEF domain-containing protein [Eoetvoesiella sp.]